MSAIIHATDDNFDAEVMHADLPVLVDFSASWCGPCKKLEPILHELASDYDTRLKVVKVDVDSAPTTAAKFGVLSVPTILLVQGGVVKAEVKSLVSKQELSDRIQKVL
jgi:thioredoxin 1